MNLSTPTKNRHTYTRSHQKEGLSSQSARLYRSCRTERKYLHHRLCSECHNLSSGLLRNILKFLVARCCSNHSKGCNNKWIELSHLLIIIKVSPKAFHLHPTLRWFRLYKAFLQNILQSPAPRCSIVSWYGEYRTVSFHCNIMLSVNYVPISLCGMTAKVLTSIWNRKSMASK